MRTMTYAQALNYIAEEIVKEYTIEEKEQLAYDTVYTCLLYTSPSPRDVEESRMPSSA